MMLHIHRGKGAKDRLVPLPQATLLILRKHWVSHRNPRLLFPAMGRDAKSARSAITPWPRARCKAPSGAPSSPRRSDNTRRACILFGIPMQPTSWKPVSISAPSNATSATAAETTMVYLHLTQAGQDNASALINHVMEGL